MTANQRGPASIEDRLNAIPDHQLPKVHKKYFVKLAKRLDKLVYVDTAMGRVSLDERQLRGLYSDSGLRPAAGDEILRRFQSPATGISVVPNPQGRPVAWDELLAEAQRTGLPQQPSLRDLGITRSSTLDEVGRVLQTRYPELAGEVFESSTALPLFEQGMNVIAGPSTGELPPGFTSFWDCVFSVLRGFALLAVLVALIVIIQGTIVTGGLFAVAAIAAIEAFFWVIGPGAVSALIVCFHLFVLGPLLMPHP